MHICDYDYMTMGITIFIEQLYMFIIIIMTNVTGIENVHYTCESVVITEILLPHSWPIFRELQYSKARNCDLLFFSG